MNKLTGRPASGISRPQTGVAAKYKPMTAADMHFPGSSPAENLSQFQPAYGAFENQIYDDQPSQYTDAEESEDYTDLDKFIHLAQEEETDEFEFVYLNPNPSNDPYDLIVVSPENLNKDRYYTISAKGLTMFSHNSPIEFIPLEDWLMEREAYRQLKQIKFFKNFRDWKTCMMWKRNVNRYRRTKRTKQLEEKLYFTHKDYQKILLEHRMTCLEMEKWKFIDVQNLIDGQSLDAFEQAQEKRRDEVKERIHRCGFRLRENINTQIQLIMDKLREEIVSRIAIDEEQKRQSGNMQMYPFKRKVTSALYEKMGFPESMNYGHRSLLRSACSKFLRFIFLAEMYVMDSLRNIYIFSVNDLIGRISDLTGINLKFEDGEAEIKRSSKEPLFIVNVEIKQDPIPEEMYVECPLEDFDMGKTDPMVFDPNFHFQLESEIDSSPSKAFANNLMQEMEVINFDPMAEKTQLLIPKLHEIWLAPQPSQNDFFDSLKRMVKKGLKSIMQIERWSRHQEFLDYSTALEEWDDMVAENWISPESIYLDPRPWLVGHKDYGMVLDDTLDTLLSSAFDEVDVFIENFHPYLFAYWKNINIDFDMLENERLRMPVEAFTNIIELFKAQKIYFETIPTEEDKGLLRMMSVEAKATIKDSPQACLKIVEDLLPKLLRRRADHCKDWINRSLRSLAGPVGNVEDFVFQRNALRDVGQYINTYKSRMDNYAALYRLAEDYLIKVHKEDLDSFIEGETAQSNLTQTIINVESNMEKNLLFFKRELNQQIPEFLEDVKFFEQKVTDEKYLTLESNLTQCVHELGEMDESVKEMEVRAEKLNEFQECLEITPTLFEEVEYVREQLDLRHNLWRGLKNWRELKEEWVKTPFKQINVPLISKKAEEFSKIVSRSENNLPESEVIRELKHLVFSFKETMPVVTAMTSPLEESHWAAIKEIIGCEFTITDTFTLGELMDLNVIEHQEAIQAVAVQAAQEADLKRQLKNVEAIWENQELPITQYKDSKDVYILGDIEDVLANLDDSCAAVNNILGNRYVASLRDEVTKWKDLLMVMQDIFEEWIICQKNWMYLENIVKSSSDIKKNLPNEVANFEAVDKFYKMQMKKTYNTNNAKNVCKYGQKLLEDFKKNNAVIDDIQKKLDSYLETKRGSFPRFYFLSDDELLEILAQSSNAQAVQPHLKKCFDNIYRLDFGPDPKATDISGMESAEKEQVEFVTVVHARREVEGWLHQVQDTMVNTLQKLMKTGKEDYELSDRKDWVQRKLHPSQVITTVAQIEWCYETEVSIRSMYDNSDSLTEWFQTNIAQLNQLTELVRGELGDIGRRTIEALITADVHNRDIVESLKNGEIDSVNEFLWQQQLRYYWDDDNDLCKVSQINADLYYGYEFMGACSRLVITPLTDKCWITITNALHIKLGANPAGPAGTGKTESTKDLAKGIGIQCIVFNCSEQVTYQMIGKLFSGLAQQGAWTCLDEFNRIDIEVLSVIAQQIRTIQTALAERLPKFWFEAKEIDLKPTCGIFVTMNPGYAGRTELPDNLKSCFRPVAMMIPDYAMIAEIMLFSKGFINARPLSKKMVKLYKLASEQLSQQSHYDFGMRAVKSVLVMAGDLKRSEPNLDEDVVLIRAMIDSNIPKFLKDDLKLFSALVQDLFPNIQIPRVDFRELKSQIAESIDKLGYQSSDIFNTKIIQLFDTMNIRFGVMIVGPTGGGKTACWQVLENAIKELRTDKRSADPRFQKVKVELLNPKSITIGELYGEINNFTQEWKDGLASKIIRAAAAEEGDEKTWVVFDGPVDSLWIENMNTVLDDSMMLCLANGQRIKLRNQMRMLFEVSDLVHASPATVSRCGMVYMSPEDLDWRCYLNSWMPRIFPDNEVLSEQLKNHIHELFVSKDKNIIESALRLKDTLPDKEPLKTIDIQSVTNVCNILEIFLDVENGFKPQENYDKQLRYVNNVFAFAVIWGIGGGLHSRSIEKFSDFCRHIFSQLVSIPIAETVFEYFIDCNRKFEMVFTHWHDIVPDFKYEKGMSYFDIIVPTVDTVRYNYMMETLYKKSKPILFTGDTGVGKSIITTKFVANFKQKELVEDVLINFSATTSSARTQSTIEAKLERKRKGYYEAVGIKRLLIVVDDINMPGVEIYGAQPPIELLRQFIDKHGFYDRTKLQWMSIGNFMLMCAGAPPGGGRNDLTPRFMRHFSIFNVPDPSNKTLTCIFNSILAGFLEANHFVDQVRKASDDAIRATIEIYDMLKANLRATPAKFHYSFNLRDVSKVVQGMLQCSHMTVNSTDPFSKLWIHECMRVFADRLINSEDTNWFTQSLHELANRHFRIGFTHDELFKEQTILYTDIMNLERNHVLYEEVSTRKKLLTFLENKQDEYNMGTTNKMTLVFFDDAVSHILRISRVLRQPRGNAMLIGVGGSGKQSLSKLASYILGHEVFQIELTRSYDLEAFRTDLKTMMLATGVEGKQMAFIFTDTQIAQQSFLEDLNSVLNTGEVTNLFPSEELDALINDLRPEVVNQMKLPDSKDIIYATFVQRVRNNLHIILCMSPVGDALRIRCRMFPSLVSCCTLDWFSKWPDEALRSVAKQFVSEIHATETMKDSLAELCMRVHRSVHQASDKFFNTLRRKVYNTPKSYLDLIKLYLQQLDAKKLESGQNKDRFQNGLNKLKETNLVVNDLQENLKTMKPDLEVQKKNTEEYAIEVKEETRKAEIIRVQVEKETEIVKKRETDCRAKHEDAERELNEAMPELENALRELEALDKQDIAQMKSFPNPPAPVLMVMDAVSTLLGKPTKWPDQKVLLGSMDFLDTLKNFNKDAIPDATIRKLRQFINKTDFKPEIVGAKVFAAKSLCMWCIAMYKYNEVSKIVNPKRENVRVIQAKLDEDMAKLAEKEAELKAVSDKVRNLQETADATAKLAKKLEDDIKITEARLIRAEQLIDLLADEGVRWEETLADLTVAIEKIIGDVFLSAANISYCGPFTGKYRRSLNKKWINWCEEKEIPFTPNFSLAKISGDPVVIRDWNIAKLPTDNVSIESAILCVESERWPIMIDPQQQAHTWIKNMEVKNELRTLQFSKGGNVKEVKEFIRNLEFCIMNGKPVLLEDIGEDLDPLIEPILSKAVFPTTDGRTLIRLGDSDINYDKQFRFYMTTKLANPHYLPEISIKVNLINFTVTFAGLEEQLLGEVVKKEKPEIEAQKNDLIVSMAADNKLLKETQATILRLIAESGGNILDDQVLIETMQISKKTSAEIDIRMTDSIKVETIVNETREKYRIVAIRGSILYFVVSQLAGIDPMYQNSLASIVELFNDSIEKSAKTQDLEVRLATLINNITENIYTNVCRGLFEAHKNIFSFLISTNIKRKAKELDENAWNYLLRGPGIVDPKTIGPLPDDFITQYSWNLINVLDQKMPKFAGLVASVKDNLDAWHDFWLSNDPLAIELPLGWSETLDVFEQLLIIKIMRPEKLMFAFSNYVDATMGQYYVQPPPVTMDKLFADTTNRKPIIFILSQGADPTMNLKKFAKDQGFADRFVILSLGKGQGPKAQKELDKGKKKGTWILLQNCHLAKSWMPELERNVEMFSDTETTISPDFRLFLTSMPEDYFPVSVLQNGIKMTTEAPRGIKSNLIRTYAEYTDESLNDCVKPDTWKTLLFGLSFFHAIVQERRKFGPLGFNIRYEFNDSDLDTSVTMLKMFLDEQEEIPWEAMTYTTGLINYGGRVTDDLDRICLMSILKKFYLPDILEKGYVFSESGLYYSMLEGDAHAYKEYINNLPAIDQPEVFGMHENANIVYQDQASTKIIETIVSIQPRDTGGSDGKSSDDIVIELAIGLLKEAPELLDLSTAHKDLFVIVEYDLIPSLSTVLLQEIERFNKLISVIHRTLSEIQKAITGEIVMSEELDAMYSAMLNSQVPPNWKNVSYPSLKPLSSWVLDLIERVHFMDDWLKNGNPNCYWISGFFFPQGFMTGTLQTHARKCTIPIDHLSFSFNVLDDTKENIKSAAADGVFIYGLFLEGARWEEDDKQLADQYPGEMYCVMPVIHFLPTQNYEPNPADYSCPAYKTSERAGVLSTTGQSTNFILGVDLPTEEPPEHWTLKGTALLCQLNT